MISLAGILASAAAAWAGFLLGGGSRPIVFVPATTIAPAKMEQMRAVQPASPLAKTAHRQEHHAGFSDSTPETAYGSPPPSSAASNEVAHSFPANHDFADSAAASPPQPRRRARGAVAEQPPYYPLVMQDLPPDTLRSQPGLLATVDRLREKFIADVGGEGQNPADPVYQERWAQSVPSSDEQLRAAIGWHAYNDLQSAAYYAQKAAR